MGIISRDGIETYKGAVLTEKSHMYMDGMEDVYAVVWDTEEETIKQINVGYYGSDGYNMMGMEWGIDATEETKRAVRRYLKRCALSEFANSVTEYKNKIRNGSHVEVMRGRKVKKGTKLEVFWVGEKETYQSRQYNWMHETEEIAGCYDTEGNKIWIKTEYLKVTDKIKSPNAKERKKFINAYVNKKARQYNA